MPSIGPIGNLENEPVNLNTGYHFLGRVTREQLFGIGQTITSHFNPSGTFLNTTTDYLKFKRDSDDLIIFVAQKPVKHSVSWQAINGGNSNQYGQPGYSGTTVGKENSGVYGDMQKTINGEKYKLRLLTGGDANPASSAGGEWDHLIVGLNTLNSSIYNNAYFGTGSGVGRQSWVQEQEISDTSNRVRRGYWSVSYFDYVSLSITVSNSTGWRPALELIPSYIVTFKDYDGTILKHTRVIKGNNAIPPADPEREGYAFIGWSIPFENVNENLEVIAQYLLF